MVEDRDVTEYHEQAGDQIQLVIADPEKEHAWISVPEAESCPLDRCR